MKSITLVVLMVLCTLLIPACTVKEPEKPAPTEEYCIKKDTNERMSLIEAKSIAQKVCGEGSGLKDTYVCNKYTGTWWIDIEIEKPGCNPACVVNVATKEAEINWRCTGALPEDDINSFEDCAAAGYPVMESYPRQCRTPDGKTHTEIIDEPIGGQRDEHGCLGPAGYSWNAEVGACVREWELDEEARKAANIAILPLSYRVTVLGVEGMDCDGCFMVLLQRNDNGNEVYIRLGNWQIVETKTPHAEEIEPTRPDQPEQPVPRREGMEMVEANNMFAIDLYREYMKDAGNIFFSPYSITTALQMTYEGAREKTAEEMEQVLHLPANDAVRRQESMSLYNELNKGDKEYMFSTANALWAQQDYQFLPQYFALVEEYYGGKVTNLDFVSKTEESRQTINTWVEEQTNDKIKDLIPPGVLDPLTRLVLTNAIYFKGEWVRQFDPEKTQKMDFRKGSGETVKTDMMISSGEESKFMYAENENLQILELPYSGDDLSMLILLPRGDDLTAVEDSIDAETLEEWRNDLKTEKVNVYIPKFKFETKYFMSETLSGMGMPTAFGYGADFSGMDGTENLFIKQVIHQAFVEVNEEGTEAAAATAVVVALKAAAPDEKIYTFKADHPFIFLIKQKRTGNILFMGRVSDPSA